jgi:hypothetical protein
MALIPAILRLRDDGNYDILDENEKIIGTYTTKGLEEELVRTRQELHDARREIYKLKMEAAARVYVENNIPASFDK